MKSKHFIVFFLTISTFLISWGKDKELLKKALLSQIEECYNQGKWECVILLIENLRNNGIHYTEYTAENRLDIVYCEALMAVGRANDAITEVKMHVNKVNPVDYFAYFILGEAYSHLHDTLNAIEAWDKAIELNPAYVRPYIHLARIYQTIDTKKSMDNYTQAIMLFSYCEFYDEVMDFGIEACKIGMNSIILHCMGYACLKKEDLQQAKKFYGMALEASPMKLRFLASIYSPDYITKNYTHQAITTFFESIRSLASIDYKEHNYSNAIARLEIIYDNICKYLENPDYIELDELYNFITSSYLLGAAAQVKLNNIPRSKELLDAANKMEEQALKFYFLKKMNNMAK